MTGGEPARIAEIEPDAQRVLIPQRVARIEIVPREHHVVSFGEVGIDAQMDDGVARVGFDDDAAVLVPPSGLLHSMCVARTRQDLARAGRDPDSHHQYILTYRSSSHSLTFPMYSCHFAPHSLRRSARERCSRTPHTPAQAVQDVE